MSKVTHPKIEEQVLKFWKENNIFKKSLDKKSPHSDYVFYDGPPFATGTPHYGHLVASLMKDVVPRYWTMKGYHVDRIWGWDCHGLPIENIVEKELKTKSKKDIEDMGIEKFNGICRSKVLKYAKDWKKTINRLGRWADMDNAYKTMDLEYMESIWWVFKELWDKGLIYEGYKSMHICPRCETTLSQSEVTEGYKDIKDLSVIAEFHLVDEKDTSVLAWTTTPWTLIGNVALAVGKDVDYVKIEKKDEGTGSLVRFILAKEKLDEIFKDQEYKIIEKFKGGKLVGKKYKPLFDYYLDKDGTRGLHSPDSPLGLELGTERQGGLWSRDANRKNLYTIQTANFVSTEEGTGVVHIAPAFGEDDMNLGKEKNLPFIQHVTMSGVLKDEVKDFKGENVKPIDNPKKTDLEIIEYLDKKGLLFSQQEYEHSYPHCWRCETPLLNYATSSYFVNVTKIKPKLLKLAKDINWSPAHIKEGRFGKWLEGARDWSISRQRFWASVIPIWKCKKCEEMKVFGSIDELRKEMSEKITKITFVRHGESERNILNIKSSSLDKLPLTKKGGKEVEKRAKNLPKDFDLIIASPVLRTKQTAKILAKELNLKIKYDDLILEYEHGEWEDLSLEDLLKHPDYQKYQTKFGEEKFNYKLGKTGETRVEIVKRVEKFIKKINQEYSGKNILVVTHAGIHACLNKVLHNIDLDKFFALEDSTAYNDWQDFYVDEQEQSFDLHKHYIDKIELKCKCGGSMKRLPDVLDCWFESGSMPYAQMHYPFENKKKFEANFPAEFIAEGADQTRAWFYYLHVIATALFNKPAFKNVIVNGIVLASDGKKMSKHLQNYPEPDLIMGKYGTDALRYYLLASPIMAAENLNFSEDGVKEAYQKVIILLSNVLAFYKLYASSNLTMKQCNNETANILDSWILSKLHTLVSEVTHQMDSYNLLASVRPIQDFINELSTWYVRRSRDRFKSNDAKPAITTLREVLLTLSKVMAPFTPFIAEHIYREIGGSLESVHLEDWPKPNQKLINKDLITQMDLVRQIASLGLEKRASAGIPVRQPLAKITVKGAAFAGSIVPTRKEGCGADMQSELEQLLKDELNILEVNWSEVKGKLSVKLDTKLTPDLETAGIIRDLTRQINNLRKQKNLTIKDRIKITYSTKSPKIKSAIEKNKDKILADTLADEVKEGEGGEEVKVKGEGIKIKI